MSKKELKTSIKCRPTLDEEQWTSTTAKKRMQSEEVS